MSDDDRRPTLDRNALDGGSVRNERPIYVTRPFLPPLSEFVPYLEQIWANQWLTNAGPFHERFESELTGYLGVPALSLFSNGTIALMVALQALEAAGEVITTPYSFVATAHSLLWNNLKPVFVDIDPRTCNMDPSKIEAAVTPETTAILPVHVYGNPCDTEAIGAVARKHGLKVVYDAAHAFGVRYNGESVLRHGDLSVLSFHATKVFNTFEGGAIASPTQETKKRIDFLKNFGFADEVTVTAPGLNGKMNEVQSAFGLLQLKHIDEALERRRAIAEFYRDRLKDIAGISLILPPAGTTSNYSYFPILVGPDYRLSRDGLYELLKKSGVFTRRYFYPLISTMPMCRELPSADPANLPVATRIADQILCLPIYPTLTLDEAKFIVTSIAGHR